MNKKILALAIAAVGSIGVAHADSETTLWGVLDGGVEHVSNVGGKTLNGYADADQQSNRWGINSTDDVGGGVKGIVHMEGGLFANGQSNTVNTIFGRQLFFGASKDGVGQLTMGRQFDTIGDYITGKQATVYASAAGENWSVADYDNMGNSIRYNNSVKYTSPEFAGGIKASAMYAFSNKADSFDDNRAFAAGIGKNAGDLQWGVAYVNANNPGSTTNGGAAGSPAGGAVDANNWGTVAKGFRNVGAAAGTNQWKIALGTVKAKLTSQLEGNVTAGQTKYNYNDGNSLKLNELDLGLSYHLTPKLAPFAAVNYTKGSGNGYFNGASITDPKYKQLNVGVDYALSKRTDLYALAVYQKANNSVANIFTTAGASSNDKQTVTSAGLRVKF